MVTVAVSAVVSVVAGSALPASVAWALPCQSCTVTVICCYQGA